MSDKDKVKSDIKRYEHQRSMKSLATVGLLGSAGLAAGAAFKRHTPLTALGLSGAFLSGFARGRAGREEGAALGRIKRFYDLRERPKFLNVNAVLPDIEKQGVLGGAAAALLGAAGMHPSHYAPVMIDVATLPYLAGVAKDRTRVHAHVATKHEMGIPLTPDEKILRAKSLIATARQEKTRLQKPGIKKLLGQLRGQYAGAATSGGALGEKIGPAMKELHSLSPTLANSALRAMRPPTEALHLPFAKHLPTFYRLTGLGKTTFSPSDPSVIKGMVGRALLLGKNISSRGALADKREKNVRNLVKHFNLRKARLAQGVEIADSVIDEVPGLRTVMRLTGKGGKHFLGNWLENPRAIKHDLQGVRHHVISGVKAGKTLALAGGLALAGSALGHYHKRHPLAENVLPAALAKKRARTDAGSQPELALS